MRKCARRVSRLVIYCGEGVENLHNDVKQENTATLLYILFFNTPSGMYQKMG
jgi:hypothetical protein